MKGGTNLRKKAHDRHKTVAEEMVVEECVGECIIGESSTMDAVEEGPSNQTISESKVEEIPLPDVAEEVIAPAGYRFMDTSIRTVLFLWFLVLNVFVPH